MDGFYRAFLVGAAEATGRFKETLRVASVAEGVMVPDNNDKEVELAAKLLANQPQFLVKAGSHACRVGVAMAPSDEAGTRVLRLSVGTIGLPPGFASYLRRRLANEPGLPPIEAKTSSGSTLTLDLAINLPTQQEKDMAIG